MKNLNEKSEEKSYNLSCLEYFWNMYAKQVNNLSSNTLSLKNTKKLTHDTYPKKK